MSEVRFIGHGFQGWTRFGATNDGASHRDAATGCKRRVAASTSFWLCGFRISCVPVFL